MCLVCGVDISHRRADAKTCSAAHRVELSVKEKRRSEALQKRENALQGARTRRAAEKGLERKIVIRWAFITQTPETRIKETPRD